MDELPAPDPEGPAAELDSPAPGPADELDGPAADANAEDPTPDPDGSAVEMSADVDDEPDLPDDEDADCDTLESDVEDDDECVPCFLPSRLSEVLSGSNVSDFTFSLLPNSLSPVCVILISALDSPLATVSLVFNSLLELITLACLTFASSVLSGSTLPTFGFTAFCESLSSRSAFRLLSLSGCSFSSLPSREVANGSDSLEEFTFLSPSPFSDFAVIYKQEGHNDTESLT